VHGFTLDPSLGEFLLSHPDLKIPDTPKYYGINQGYETYWHEGTRRFVEWITGRDRENPRSPLSMRYSGALVADFHRILLSGGIFMYPADTKDKKSPYGKLRLAYECAPLAFIAQQAGGYASDGVQSVLTIQPHSLHQRIPFNVGSRDLVEKLEQYVKKHDCTWVQAYQEFLRTQEDKAADAAAAIFAQ
jgi:fructose-1,6-bisphosphatase I